MPNFTKCASHCFIAYSNDFILRIDAFPLCANDNKTSLKCTSVI